MFEMEGPPMGALGDLWLALARLAVDVAEVQMALATPPPPMTGGGGADWMRAYA